jgi:hypothetical protein
MHINQMLVQYLERTMDHSLSKLELWSIWKKSSNQPLWCTNQSKHISLRIFWLFQNPCRIRRNCEYKSCSKLHLLSPQIFWEFFSPRRYFSRGEFSFWHLNSIENYLGAAPPVIGSLHHRAHLDASPHSWCGRHRRRRHAHKLRPPHVGTSALSLLLGRHAAWAARPWAACTTVQDSRACPIQMGQRWIRPVSR